MVIPCGERYQQTLYLLKKTDGKPGGEALQPMLFVPMTGKAEANARSGPIPRGRRSKTAASKASPAILPLPPAGITSGNSKLIGDKDAPEGEKYITFRTPRPDAAARRYRDFAVNGRKVVQLRDFGASSRPRHSPGLGRRSSGPPSSSISTTNTVR